MHCRDIITNAVIALMVTIVVVLFGVAFCGKARAHGIPPQYVAAIKASEGFSARAYWDHAQWSIGYGTRARHPGEVIDEEEAERRFFTELSAAAAFVDRNFPDLDAGTRAALASLTYNAGPSWANSRLGELIRSGDLQGARAVFLQYVRASGAVVGGLVRRRLQEAAWFGARPAPNAVIRECRMPDGQIARMKVPQ